MKFILKTLIMALVVLGISYFLPGIFVENFWPALIFAVVLGLMNALVKPLISLLTLPIKILTLGLFSFVINTFMFWLAGKLISGVNIESLSSAFWGALILWAASIIVNKAFKNNKKKK